MLACRLVYGDGDGRLDTRLQPTFVVATFGYADL